MNGLDGLELPPRPSQDSDHGPSDRRTSEDLNESPNGSNGQRQVKKRNRIPVSCNECRRRKLR
jgi:hypothetical protein